jgi:hypothetical protein
MIGTPRPLSPAISLAVCGFIGSMKRSPVVVISPSALSPWV